MQTRNNFTLSKEVAEILKKIAQKTGLKKSTIVEKAIILYNETHK